MSSPGRNRTQWTPDMDDTLRRSEGVASAASVARTMRLSFDTVRKRMRELGIKPLKPGWHNKTSKYRIHEETIQVLLALGMSQAKIAAECDLDEKTISKWRHNDRISEIREELAMPGFKEATPEQLVQIRLMRAAGSPWYEVAKAIKASETITVRWAVEHLGYEVKPRPPSPKGTRANAAPPKKPPVVVAAPETPSEPTRTRWEPLPAFDPMTWGAINVPWEQFHQQLGLATGS